jgi:hypothetical protein
MSFLGQAFNTSFIFLEYQLNKEYISKNLCENRDKPEMKCEGRCYLCKRLKKEENKDQENPNRKLDKRSEIIPFHEGFHFLVPLCSINSIQYTPYSEEICNYFFASFFHPPTG